MIRGGWMPGGSWRRIVCDTAVTCALAVSRRACGCRKILTIAWPFTVVDSMCSMLSTVVVRIRSYCVVIRPSISSGLRPVNCQATAITGDAREYVGGRAEEDHRARDEDEQGEHDEGVGTVESDPDDPHRSAMASDQVVPLHRLQTAESAGRLQQPERAAVT